ncbi:MAG: hypothetical protein ACR2NN_06705 [Bryobacteraceae bacterium]
MNRDAGRNRFAHAKGAFGDGVNGYQLVPYRTVAAVGVPLPDGSRHDGYFLAADTGDMKDFHIDVFQGLQPAPFRFIHSKPTPVIPAYIVDDDRIREALTQLHRNQSAGFVIGKFDLNNLTNLSMVMENAGATGPAPVATKPHFSRALYRRLKIPGTMKIFGGLDGNPV